MCPSRLEGGRALEAEWAAAEQDSDDEDESLADEDVWTAVPEPPPALKPGMQLLVDREIVGAQGLGSRPFLSNPGAD